MMHTSPCLWQPKRWARAHACLLQRMPINALFPPQVMTTWAIKDKRVCNTPPSRSILALLQSEPTHTIGRNVWCYYQNIYSKLNTWDALLLAIKAMHIAGWSVNVGVCDGRCVWSSTKAWLHKWHHYGCEAAFTLPVPSIGEAQRAETLFSQFGVK